MSLSPQQWAELEELMGAVRDGQLTPEQEAQLEAWIVNEPEARAYYLDYMAICATLRHFQGAAAELPHRDDPGPEILTAPIAGDIAKQGGAPGRWSHPIVRNIGIGVAAAALLIAGARLLRPVGRANPEAGEKAIAQTTGFEAQVAPSSSPAPGRAGSRLADRIAVVVDLENVRWEDTSRGGADSAPAPRVGTVLGRGTLRIAGGRATLEFLTGVKLNVAGPAEIDLIDREHVFCHRGKLRARVPKGAEGFVVESPGSAVVDLGTEFGLNVAADGKSELMVFEGLAEAALLDDAGALKRGQLVGRSEAYALDPHADRIAESPAAPGGFLPARAQADPALVLDDAYPAEVLSARPAGYWRFETTARELVPNEVAGGRPLRIHGPIGVAPDSATAGNGCARFGPDAPEQYLDTEGLWNLARSPGHAVEFWVLADDIRYATIVGLYPPIETIPPGQDSRYAHTFLAELISVGRRLQKPASVRFLHRWPPDIRIEFNVFSGPVYIPHRWHHVVAQKVGPRMELYFDGAPAAPLSLAPDHPDSACHLVVGRRTPDPTDTKDNRSFVGRLDELALYDHPLSPEEVARHHHLAVQRVPGK